MSAVSSSSSTAPPAPDNKSEEQEQESAGVFSDLDVERFVHELISLNEARS